MRIPGKKVEAIFEKRINRFVARVNLMGKSMEVHVPNSGRLKEILTPGARVILREAESPVRKFKYDIILAYKDGILVSIDSVLPNKLVKVFLEDKIRLLKQFEGRTIAPLLSFKDFTKLSKLAEEKSAKEAIAGAETAELNGLFKYDFVTPEVKFKNSRFDLGLGRENKAGDDINIHAKEKDNIEYYMEIKGVTLVEKNIARFPDAPTERGTKHLLELIEAKMRGFGAGIFFVIQREDADIFSPNDAIDPAFGKALRDAASAGVDIFAYRCEVEHDEIELTDKIKELL